MKLTSFLLIVTLGSLSCASAQQSSTPATSDVSTAVTSSIPQLVNYSGTLTDLRGMPLTDAVGVTFLLYGEPRGGEAIWAETQNVQPDKTGHYSVVLGSTLSQGLPQDLFSTGEARWLGIQVPGEEEPPRTLLVAVPYALKAGDAETFGGLPPSAFMLANGNRIHDESAPSTTPSPKASTNPALTGNGTAGYLAKWDATSDIANSLIFQKSTSLGIGTTAPAATLDVNGKADLRDTLTLLPNGTDSTLAVSGTSFKIDQLGKVTFASGQTFPGAGTLTGLTTSSTSGLQGGGTIGIPNLSVMPAGITNAMLQHPSLTVPVTAPLIGGGAVSLGGAAAPLALRPCPAGEVLISNGTTWSCTAAAGTGKVTSVALSAPSSDFTVTGSPITGSGTLAFNWNVPPSSGNTPNTIVKRDSYGSFQAQDIVSYGKLSAFGNSYLWGAVGIGTFSPQALVNLNLNSTANSDSLLLGNTTTKGVQLRDTGVGVDLESFGVPLYVNWTTGQPTYFGSGPVGIGTFAPAAELNLNRGGTANSDSLLLGNNTTRGIQMRDSGSGMDLESIGVPLYVNYGTKQPLFLNPNGGAIGLGTTNTEIGFSGNGEGVTPVLTVGANAGPDGNFYSAYFLNDVIIGGNLRVFGTKDFRIDHPLDPANKYLDHAAIESSEVLNQYSGNIVLDGHGEGRVEFPDWFAAINDDFRYQLTAVGVPGPNLYVSKEINGNSFTIAGGAPGSKVSWQVTGRRSDAYMKAHPFVVERDKPEQERGHYANPELYGASTEQRTH